jgi:23S rRNA pseudouridine2605 synthase
MAYYDKTLTEVVRDIIDNIHDALPEADTREGTFIRDVFVDPISDEISTMYLDMRMLKLSQSVLTAVSDDLDRKTVVDLIETKKRIYPVGRLDYNTTGILILTNDGELDNILTHPSHHVPKTYVAKLNRVLEIEDLKKLQKGVDIDGRICKPTRVKLKSIDKAKDTCLVEVTIIEGRNHIVKRLFESCGYLVDKLTRTSYGFLTLDGLKSGEYRQLSIKEVHKLYDYKNSNKKVR